MNNLLEFAPLEEGTHYCAACHKEMKLVLLKNYTFEEGLPLHNMPAYTCLQCHEFFFTEEQAKTMELKTEQLKK